MCWIKLPNMKFKRFSECRKAPKTKTKTTTQNTSYSAAELSQLWKGISSLRPAAFARDECNFSEMLTSQRMLSYGAGSVCNLIMKSQQGKGRGRSKSTTHWARRANIHKQPEEQPQQKQSWLLAFCKTLTPCCALCDFRISTYALSSGILVLQQRA